MKMQKNAALILVAAALAAQAGQVAAADNPKAEAVNLSLDGKIHTGIHLKNDRAFIPLRSFLNDISMNDATLSIVWKEDMATVTIDGKTASFQVGNTVTKVNGKDITLNSAPFVSNGVLYVPATALKAVYGKSVAWDQATKTVIATTSNADKAVAVLEGLENGSPDALLAFVDPNYIQHNLTLPTGRDVIIGALPSLKASGTAVKPVRVLVDGDFVAVHSEYNFGGPKAGFDIFRFEDGKIVEHWDNLQTLADPNPSGHTMLDGQTTITDLGKTEANKTYVKGFVENILMGKKPELLTTYFNGDNYVQHNPSIADGLSGLGAALQAMAEQGIEMKYDRIHQVIGQGNFVLVISEGSFAGQHTAFYDLFRVENGKIAEHWDVLETVLPQEQHANTNGKFNF